MSTDTFVLYSTANISCDEYTSWHQQLGAVMTPEEGGPYDARLSKDVCHVWIALLEGKWFEMDMAEFAGEPEVSTRICQLLGGEPKSAIVLDVNEEEGSQILAVEFVALCAERYPCAVLQAAGQAIFSAQEILELRDVGMGFDGSTWATAASRSTFSWIAHLLADDDEDEYDEEEESEDALQLEEVYDYRIKPPTEGDRADGST